MRAIVAASAALTCWLTACSTAPPVASSFSLQRTADRAEALAPAPDLALLNGVFPAPPAFSNAFDGYVGSVTAVGPLATFENPTALTFDPSGSLYIADGPCIRRIAPDAAGRETSSTVAGDWTQRGSADGHVFQARFGWIWAMAAMPDGSLIVADGYRLRRIAFDGAGGGIVTTIAGTEEQGYVDGDGATARFDVIAGLAVAADGTIYAAEGSRIRKVAYDAATGTTAVATWFTGESVSELEPPSVDRVAVAPDGAVWIAGAGRVRRLRTEADGRVVADLVVTGNEPSTLPGDPAGAAFTWVTGMAVMQGGEVIVHDSGPQPLVRRITLDGDGHAQVSTLARPIPFQGPSRRYWSPRERGLDQPSQVAVGPRGEIRLLDETSVRAIDIDAAGNGTPRTYAGWPLQVSRQDGPIAPTAVHPDAIVSDGRGGYFVTVWNSLWAMELTPMGGATSRFVAGHKDLGKVDGVGDQARFDMPNELLREPDGSLIVCDYQNGLLRRVTFDADGQATVKTIAGGGPNRYTESSLTAGDGPALSASMGPSGSLCRGPDGTIYFGDNYRIRKLARDESGQMRVTSLAGRTLIGIQCKDGPGPEARFGTIGGMVMDRAGALIMSDTDNSLIRKVVFDEAGAVTVSTLAGKFVGTVYNTTSGFRDGPASEALFKLPTDIELAEDGSFLVVDRGNHAIRRLAQATDGTWHVSTMVGPGEGMRDGPLSLARLSLPLQLEPAGPGRYLLIEGRFPTNQLRTIRLGAGR